MQRDQLYIEYQSTGTDFGLTFSIPKTKRNAIRREVVDSGITVVEEFPYLGSMRATSGRMDVDVER